MKLDCFRIIISLHSASFLHPHPALLGPLHVSSGLKSYGVGSNICVFAEGGGNIHSTYSDAPLSTLRRWHLSAESRINLNILGCRIGKARGNCEGYPPGRRDEKTTYLPMYLVDVKVELAYYLIIGLITCRTCRNINAFELSDPTGYPDMQTVSHGHIGKWRGKLKSVVIG
ncbi:hypothetical protein GGR54DRAFT_623943, partial [Hypoxylon sp. NC1633]